MAQKNASPTKAQAEVIARNGLNKLEWTVIKDLPNSMIVRNRASGAVEVISK